MSFLESVFGGGGSAPAPVVGQSDADYQAKLDADQAKALADAASRHRQSLRDQLTIDLPEAGTGLQIPV